MDELKQLSLLADILSINGFVIKDRKRHIPYLRVMEFDMKKDDISLIIQVYDEDDVLKYDITDSITHVEIVVTRDKFNANKTLITRCLDCANSITLSIL